MIDAAVKQKLTRISGDGKTSGCRQAETYKQKSILTDMSDSQILLRFSVHV